MLPESIFSVGMSSHTYDASANDILSVISGRKKGEYTYVEYILCAPREILGGTKYDCFS